MTTARTRGFSHAALLDRARALGRPPASRYRSANASTLPPRPPRPEAGLPFDKAFVDKALKTLGKGAEEGEGESRE
jgi:hypothetical protein